VRRLTQERRKMGLSVDDDAIAEAVEQEEKAQKNRRKVEAKVSCKFVVLRCDWLGRLDDILAIVVK